VPDRIADSIGRNTKFAIRRTASRGVQCSPAFVVLLVETSSSKTVPIEWLSMPAGERSMSGSRNLLISVPMASALDSVCNWLRNLKLSRMSWTLAEKPLR
jgi:hypothetical protein